MAIKPIIFFFTPLHGTSPFKAILNCYFAKDLRILSFYVFTMSREMLYSRSRKSEPLLGYSCYVLVFHLKPGTSPLCFLDSSSVKTR